MRPGVTYFWNVRKDGLKRTRFSRTLKLTWKKSLQIPKRNRVASPLAAIHFLYWKTWLRPGTTLILLGFFLEFVVLTPGTNKRPFVTFLFFKLSCKSQPVPSGAPKKHGGTQLLKNTESFLLKIFGLGGGTTPLFHKQTNKFMYLYSIKSYLLYIGVGAFCPTFLLDAPGIT